MRQINMQPEQLDQPEKKKHSTAKSAWELQAASAHKERSTVITFL